MLNLRVELGTKSQIAATVKHGEKLEVLETRRHFAKVRATSGAEGWTDINLLLSDRQMAELRVLATSAAKLPSQGTAKVYDALNVHAEPYRSSPSFFQIPEGGTVEVISHRRTPHTPPPTPSKAVTVHRAAANKKAKGKTTAAPLAPPPSPPPPNWPELAKLHAEPAKPALPAAPPAPEDDWNLVRTPSGDSGWALARMLVMEVPEEVGQYAEGHRITSYLPLGEVQDKEKGGTKQNWIWTTASTGLRPYDFDSFRVFVWSTKHHRYETAYIERNVKGYYPVLTESVPGQDEKAFSVVLEDKTGQLYRETFAFNGYHIRMASKSPCQLPPPLPEVHGLTSFEPEAPPAAPESGSLATRLHDWWARLRGK